MYQYACLFTHTFHICLHVCIYILHKIIFVRILQAWSLVGSFHLTKSSLSCTLDLHVSSKHSKLELNVSTYITYISPLQHESCKKIPLQIKFNCCIICVAIRFCLCLLMRKCIYIFSVWNQGHTVPLKSTWGVLRVGLECAFYGFLEFLYIHTPVDYILLHSYKHYESEMVTAISEIFFRTTSNFTLRNLFLK